MIISKIEVWYDLKNKNNFLKSFAVSERLHIFAIANNNEVSFRRVTVIAQLSLGFFYAQNIKSLAVAIP